MNLPISRLAALTVWLAALPLLSARAEPQPLVAGAAKLMSLAQVTVVYPTRPEEDRDVNRLSARRRAAYLESVHGVEAVVVADDAIDEEQLRGHLLVLGFENRLLGSDAAPRPFERTKDRLMFLDQIVGSAEDDLLFVHVSPFNPERYLFFWSRIDPELDRFSVLPFIGSDWALYDGYTVLRQGMFDGGQGWPPVRDSGAEMDHRLRSGAALSERRSPHYTLHYDADRIGEEEATKILEAREAALERAVDALGPAPEGFRIDLHVYATDDEKLRRTSVPDPAHGIPRRFESHMTLSMARSSNPHEDLHFLARSRFGPCYLTALCEGLSIALRQPAGSNELATYAALMVEHDVLPTIDELLDEETNRELSRDGGAGFPASALFVSWLRSTTDLETLGRIYTLREATVADVARLIGRPPQKTEKQFTKWVEKQAGSAEQEFAFRNAIAEAKALREEGDRSAEAIALRRALELRPEDPKTLYKLALSLMESGDLDGSEQTLRRLLALTLSSRDAHYILFGHYQLGRLFGRQGRREESMEQYRRVLELPDRYEAHRLAREAIDAAPSENQPGLSSSD